MWFIYHSNVRHQTDQIVKLCHSVWKRNIFLCSSSDLKLGSVLSDPITSNVNKHVHCFRLQRPQMHCCFWSGVLTHVCVYCKQRIWLVAQIIWKSNIWFFFAVDYVDQSILSLITLTIKFNLGKLHLVRWSSWIICLIWLQLERDRLLGELNWI